MAPEIGSPPTVKVPSVFPAWETADFKGRQPITQGLARVKLRFGPDSAMYWASLAAQVVTYLPAMQETQVQSLDQEDTLEDRMATHSSILAWEIPWTEEPGVATVLGVTKSQTGLSE